MNSFGFTYDHEGDIVMHDASKRIIGILWSWTARESAGAVMSSLSDSFKTMTLQQVDEEEDDYDEDEMAEIPFLKQLVASDRKTRDDALLSLQKYLSSGRDFSDLELLKLWRGLFFCMWHSDRPLPQQRLATSLSNILLDLPTPLFNPYVRAFWLTMAREWSSIDALRLEKFLRLVRGMVNSTFTYLKRQVWRDDLLSPYLALIETLLVGSFTGTNVKAPDGLKYHIVDVWIDELDKVDDDDEEVGDKIELFMAPLKKTETKGVTKALRARALAVLADERLKDWGSRNDESGDEKEVGKSSGTHEEVIGIGGDDDEWGGIED